MIYQAEFPELTAEAAGLDCQVLSLVLPVSAFLLFFLMWLVMYSHSPM